jgi:hypothetical protein
LNGCGAKKTPIYWRFSEIQQLIENEIFNSWPCGPVNGAAREKSRPSTYWRANSSTGIEMRFQAACNKI